MSWTHGRNHPPWTHFGNSRPHLPQPHGFLCDLYKPIRSVLLTIASPLPFPINVMLALVPPASFPPLGPGITALQYPWSHSKLVSQRTSPLCHPSHDPSENLGDLEPWRELWTVGCLSSQVGTSPAESSGSKSVACAAVYAEPPSSSTRVCHYNIRERVSPKSATWKRQGLSLKVAQI